MISESSEASNQPVATVVHEGININFSTYYGKDIREYDYFSMKRKRNFSSNADECAARLNLLLADRRFALRLVSLRYDLALPEGDADYLDEGAFARRLAALFAPETVAAVRLRADALYEEAGVDVNTDHAAKNEELQFTNDHARTILQWSYACMAVTPVITAFMRERDMQSRDSVSLIFGCFGSILGAFEGEGVDILAKLRRLVESRVLQTRYSDKVMWNYLLNVATDPHIFVDRLFRRFVTDAIPKLTQGTNVIAFFHTFLKNQIRYQFTARFALSYKPVRTDVMDKEGVSAIEHLETELIRQDEGAIVVGDAVCSAAISGVEEELGWSPPSSSVRHWERMLVGNGINAWQKGVVTKFFLGRIGQVQLLRSRSLRDYVRMMLLTRRWLEENEFPVLGEYMRSRMYEAMDGRRMSAKKRFIRDFVGSAQYRELLGGMFSVAGQTIVDSDVVINMISALHTGRFERIPDTPEEEDAEPVGVDHRIETVAQEVLRFISHVSR
jgi:hypothetical protein